MDFPVYKLVINPEDEESGVDFIALVDDPAIERNFQAFKANPQFSFKTTDEAQHIISGPFMVANMPIYRNDAFHGQHYVVFDTDTIRQIIYKFFRSGFTSNVNLMHSDADKTSGIYLFESFIIDCEKGVCTPKGFDTLPDGSWFGSYKVDNQAIWDEFIKTGTFKGFSVEGFFEYVPDFTNNTEYASQKQLLEEIEKIIAAIG